MNEQTNINTENNCSYAVIDTTKPPVRIYSATEIVFAWICFVFGYLFCRAFPVTFNPLGGFLFVCLLFGSTFVVLKLKGARFSHILLLTALSAVILSISLILTDSEFIATLSYSYSLASYCYFVYCAYGNQMEKGLSDFAFVDYFKAIFIAPFYSIVNIFRAASQGKTKNGMNFAVKILGGIALAAVPTVVIIVLLAYDDGFVSILTNLFSFSFETVASHITSIIFAVPLGMYIFGLYDSSVEKTLSDSVTADDCKSALEKIKRLPQLTALTAVLPILFVYVIYFISQWKYYVSGFTGVLPENFSYAEYAREGFFQLCTVSVINLLILMAVVMFMRRGGKRSCPLLKIITVVFCLFTLVLISTAVAKLVMYIDCYGLTHKRVYAMWLMAVIAIVYIIIAIGQFSNRLKTVSLSLSVSIIMFGLLALGNVNRIIADYNVDRYIDGELDTVDTTALWQLGDSAIPAAARLANELEDRKAAGEDYSINLYEKVQAKLKLRAEQLSNSDGSVFSFNIPEFRAKNTLIDLGLLEK